MKGISEKIKNVLKKDEIIQLLSSKKMKKMVLKVELDKDDEVILNKIELIFNDLNKEDKEVVASFIRSKFDI